MYGQFVEDLSQFAKCEARRSSALPNNIEKDVSSIRQLRKSTSWAAKRKIAG
jgi:hypothetical protein